VFPGPRQREVWRVLFDTIFRDVIFEHAFLKFESRALVLICESGIYSRRRIIIYRTGYGEHIVYKIKTQETSHIGRVVGDSENKGAY
jgi:hypothetical protein